MMRPAPATEKTSNDPKIVFLDCATSESTQHRAPFEPAARPQAFHLGPRALLIAAFGGSVLVALSGAFMIGLALIGLVAAAVASFELVCRQLWPPSNRRSAVSIIE